MKHTQALAIVLFTFLLTVSNAPAQGTITFINNSSTLIEYAYPSGDREPVPAGSFTVGLYYGVEGTTDHEALTLISSTGIVAPGRFVGGLVTTPTTTPGGGMAVFQIRAWQATFPTYDTAFSSGGLIGFTAMWTQITGNATPTDLPKPIVPPTGGFTGMVIPIPEPSVVAISGLALALLAFFRVRRGT